MQPKDFIVEIFIAQQCFQKSLVWNFNNFDCKMLLEGDDWEVQICDL